MINYTFTGQEPATSKKVIEVINKIKDPQNAKGAYQFKVLCHLHTPASYDYALHKAWSNGEHNYYRDYLDKESLSKALFKECVARGLVVKDPVSFRTIEDIKFSAYLPNPGVDKIYEDSIEKTAFLILADELEKNEIDIAVVMDHNTVEGYRKLCKALAVVNKIKGGRKVKTKALPGVEISCADRLHVGIIFNSTDECLKKVEIWLENHLYNQEGTYETSFTTIQSLTDILTEENIISYIAHINTAAVLSSDIDKKIVTVTGAYKKILFNSELIHLLGVNDLSKIEEVRKRISQYSDRQFDFILDNDSHCVEDVEKNLFWIKGRKGGFVSFKDAFQDYDISVSLTAPLLPDQFIEGMLIDARRYKKDEWGFLVDKDKTGKIKPFIVQFSPKLNCFIGGRGSGKSTVLEMLKLGLTLECNSRSLLNFMCEHGNLWILYRLNNREYLINIILPNPDEEMDRDAYGWFLRKGDKPDYYSEEYYDKKFAKEIFSRSLLEAYEIENQIIKTLPKYEALIILPKLLENKYSVNELVNITKGNAIHGFIKSIMKLDSGNLKISNYKRPKSHSDFVAFLDELKANIANREYNLKNLIGSFNEKERGLLKIQTVPNDNILFQFINSWCNECFVERGKYIKLGKTSYKINKDGIEAFLQVVLNPNKKIILQADEVISVLLKLCQRDFSGIRIDDLIRNSGKLKQSDIDNEVEEITHENGEFVMETIFGNLFKSSFIPKVFEYIMNLAKSLDQFNLYFNVRSNTQEYDKQPVYKSVNDISLGQKVTALLDFIFAYGEYTHDLRPLIIDQPEDNLDNKYIYENLVQQLRKERDKRQVIIATHNSTIVTNSISDVVFVMKSDGTHGWVDCAGYVGEKEIKKILVDYLEGGVRSFIHKTHMYQPVLK